MRIHNTLSGTKEIWTLSKENPVRIYVCGPTVYDFAHLGHVRCYTIYDVLVRFLRNSGYPVVYVRNITDIDDKIITRGRERGMDPVAVANIFTQAFHEDMAAVGNQSPDIEPKVSEHLEEIRVLIDRLVHKGAAYVVDGDVYFSIASKADYGKLSKRKPTDLQSGASGRLDDEEQKRKRHPDDFALWKASAQGEIGWTSPSCVSANRPGAMGRPGWHIECSAMGLKHLGETFDLHGGGLDLVFPHHENELAQSETASGKPLARVWMHNGFVEVNKEKMSKSLGNFFTARDVFKKYPPEAVRYAMLGVHYRSPLGIDWAVDQQGHLQGFPLFDEAEARLEYLYTTQLRLSACGQDVDSVDTLSQGLAEALDDDLNTPVALSWVSELLREINETCDRVQKKNASVAPRIWRGLIRGMQDIRRVLGLGTDDPALWLRQARQKKALRRGLDTERIERYLRERQDARLKKDFVRADEIRKTLDALGVELMDREGHSDWRIK